MTALVVLEAFVIALLVVLVAGLLRSHAEILRKLHDLGAGDHDHELGRAAAATGESALPGGREPQDGVIPPRPEIGGGYDVVGTIPGGGQRKISVVGADHPTLLAFLSSGCLTCAEFWTRFGRSSDLDLPGPETRLVIVTKSAGSESESEILAKAPTDVPTVMSSEAWERYGVPGSPYFILVDGPTGAVIGEGSGTSWKQVSSLMRSALADAGLELQRARKPRARADGRAREARADAELAAAGIGPGHPSLYPTDLPQYELIPPEIEESSRS